MPPVPLSPPRLLAKESWQLVLSPVDHFSGDGPIISVKVLYRPNDDTSPWSSIVGKEFNAHGSSDHSTPVHSLQGSLQSVLAIAAVLSSSERVPGEATYRVKQNIVNSIDHEGEQLLGCAATRQGPAGNDGD